MVSYHSEEHIIGKKIKLSVLTANSTSCNFKSQEMYVSNVYIHFKMRKWKKMIGTHTHTVIHTAIVPHTLPKH